MSAGEKAAVGVDGRPARDLRVALPDVGATFAGLAEAELLGEQDLARAEGIVHLGDVDVVGSDPRLLIHFVNELLNGAFGLLGLAPVILGSGAGPGVHEDGG